MMKLACFGGAGLLLLVYEIRKLVWVPAIAPSEASGRAASDV